MSRLYEINERMAEVLSRLDGNEFGEIENFDGIVAEVDALNMEKAQILEWVAKEYLNTQDDIDGLKKEIDRLSDRKKKAEKRAERLLDVLIRETGGVKTNLGVATLSTRKSTSVHIDEEAIAFLKENCPDLVHVSTTETVDKNAVKELLKQGKEIKGCTLVESVNYSVK